MKATIATLLLRGLIVVVALFAIVPLAHAQSHTARMPYGTCYGDSCDHVLPPPLSNCSNDITLNTKTIYDFNGVAIGQLNLFADQTNCYALWAGLKDIYNPGGQCFTITDLQIIETDHDQSAQGAIDSIPHAMCSPGQWESTKMNGWTLDQTYYHDYAHSVVTDELGYTNDITNTATAHCAGFPRTIPKCSV